MKIVKSAKISIVVVCIIIISGCQANQGVDYSYGEDNEIIVKKGRRRFIRGCGKCGFVDGPRT